MDVLKKKKQKILVKKAQTEGTKLRIKEMEEFIKSADQELEEYDETMVRRYIEGIKVFDDKFIVIFKAGNEVEVTR